MKKNYLILSSVFFLIFSIGITQTYSASPKIDKKQYMAMVAIDKDTGELEDNGDIYVPYFLYIGFNESNNTCYGSFVRPLRISASDGFGLQHLAISKGILKSAKKLVFNLTNENKIIYKKIRAIIKQNGKYLILKMKYVDGKIRPVEFHPFDTDLGGIFINNLPNVERLDSGTAKKGNIIAGVKVNTDEDQVLPDPTKDRVSVATTGIIDNVWWTTSMEADLIKQGSFYYAQSGNNYFEFEREAKNKNRFIYRNDQFNRIGYMSNMGGNGKAPRLKRNKVQKISNKFVKVFLNDTKGIDFGFYAELNVKNPSNIWITETGRDPDNDYSYILLQKKTGFKGNVKIKVNNPDGTSSQVTVNIPK